jgi:DNA polymerase-3 subunit epsilon
MIFFDVETTGLIKNEALPTTLQPQIIEIGALKTDDKGNEVAVFETLVNPGVALPKVIIDITGIKDEDFAAASAGPFAEYYGALAEFFRGERTMLAHNARFDQMLLVFELRRIGKEHQFPYCSDVIDTRTVWPGKLQEWAKLVRGPDYVQEHRAVSDCRLLRDCWFSKLHGAEAGEGPK